MSTKETIKIVVLGGGGVGKSALTVQYVQNIFVNKYDPTIEDSYRKHVSVGDTMNVVEILDTAGTEQFTAMRDLYIKNAHGIVLVYSIITRPSIADIEDIYNQIRHIRDNVPIIVCGNKSDLEDDRVITKEEGEMLANRIGAQFMETSAYLRTNVVEAFEKIIYTVVKNREDELRISKSRNKCRCTIL